MGPLAPYLGAVFIISIGVISWAIIEPKDKKKKEEKHGN